MKIKNKKTIIFVAILLAFGLIVAINYHFAKDKTPTVAEREEVKKSFIKDLEGEIGGEIIERGFSISYESGKKLFVITITDMPFEENRDRAFEYLKSKNIYLCDEDYILMAGRGIESPEGLEGVGGGCDLENWQE
jgi:hypothetical protein